MRLSLTRFLLAFLLVATSIPAAAQGPALLAGKAPAADKTASDGPQPIALAGLPARADADERFAGAVVARAAASDPLAGLLPGLRAIEGSVDGKVRGVAPAQLRTLPILRLESLDRHWNFDARQFARWKARYQAAGGSFASDAADVSGRLAVWRATRAAFPPGSLPDALSERIDAVSAELQGAEQALSAPLAAQIALGRRANALDARIQAGGEQVDAAIEDIDRRLLHLDAPPLWRAGADDAGADAEAAISRGLDIELAFAREYGNADVPNRRALLVLQVLLLPLLLWLAWWVRRQGAEPAGEGPSQALRRPVSCWLLLAMLAVMVFEPDAPLLVQQWAMVIALVPVLRLIPAHSRRLLGGWPYLAAAFFLLLRLAMLLLDNSLLYRAYQLLLASAAIASTLWLLWRARAVLPRAAAAQARQGRAGTVMRSLAWVSVGLLGMSIIANVAGNVSLAEMLLAGVIDSGYMALLLFAAFNLAVALLEIVFAHPSAAGLHLVRVQDTRLLDLLRRLLAIAAVAGWLVFALQRFRLFRPVYGLLRDVLTHQFAYGEFSLSLGDVLAFVLAVFIAFWVASLVRVLLRDQVLSRMSLPRGVGNSVSSLAYYALLMVGLLASLSVAGFKVGQLTLLFGALGVGIGLGLQDVVKNFVSGLILMFERPIQPGDVVDVEGTGGQVREIGMRATTIRRFDGADVIVPNGMLVAERVTNWTLRDRIARIEIAVGVAYGSDVDRVAALLEQAVQQTPRIAGHPPPVVLFRELGPSSLDFVVRAWTGFDDQQAVRSALLGRIYQALVDAGIEIPFPQQDLHLRGLPDGLADALSRRAAAGDPAADVPPSAAPPADGGHGGTDRRAPDR